MAGPSIVVRVLGDLKGLGASFNDAGAKASSAGSRIHGAFQTVLGQLNASGVLGPFGGALQQVDESLSHIAEHGKRVGVVLMGAGGAITGVGAALSAFGSKEKASQQQLAQAITNTGGSYSDYADRIDQAIKHNERFGNTAADTRDALRTLTDATGSPTKALAMLNTASDLAAAKHESLTTAAGQLGKTYGGSAKLLKAYGITTKDATGALKTHDQVIAELSAKLHGQAAAASDTFTGKLKALGTVVEDNVAAIGAKYGPAITAAGAGMTALGAITETTSSLLSKFGLAEKIGAAVHYVYAAAEAAASAAGLPLVVTIGLIGLAIAALVIGIYELWKHWDTVWGFIKKAAQAVWNWIKQNWPLLVGILLGPIALAAALIYKYWDKIKLAAKAVWDWIKGHWPLLLAIIAGPIGLAVTQVIKHWDTIKAAAVAVWNWLKNTWRTVTGHITGPISAAVATVQRLWGQIKQAGVTAWNWITTTWRSVTGHVTGPITSAVNTITAAWGRLTGILSGPFNAVVSAVQSAIRWIDTLIGKIAGIPGAINNALGGLPGKVAGVVGKIGGVAGKALSLVGLQEGGIITQTGIVFAHAGEIIAPPEKIAATAPLAAAGRNGPAVVINEAHFASDIDIELFMKRAAWYVQTERI